MKITIQHFDGKYPQFNVLLSSGEGKEPFLTIRGCRIVDGRDGKFVSWPATKNEGTGKYWNHVMSSEPFGAAVIEESEKSQPQRTHGQMKRGAADDSDIPF